MRLYNALLSSVILFAAQAGAQSLNPNIVWGVNSQHLLWHLSGSTWNQVAAPGGATLIQASASPDGTVWSLDQNNNIYSLTASGWQQVQGKLTQVSVANAANVWGVNAANAIWRWDGSQWNLIPGIATQVSVGSDGTVWSLNSGNIFSYTGSGWQQMPGQLAQVSVGNATNIWGVNSQQMVWRWDGSQWNAMPGSMAQVSVGADGTVYALDPAGSIYSWNGSAWQVIPGQLQQVSAGLGDRSHYNSPAIKGQGTWSTQSNASASGGAYLQSSSPGDTIAFTFTGDSIALYRLMDTSGGQASVTIDGNAMGTITFNFSSQRWQVPAVFDHLGGGRHTLVLTVGQPPTPTSTNVYIDSFAAPAPFVANADQQAALSELNLYRAQAGLPTAALTKAADLSAQSIADYNAINNTQTHVEDPAAPNFAGVSFMDRMAYFGYSSAASEDIHNFQPAASIDDWMAMVYHRVPILTYSYTDIGFGLSTLNGNLRTAMDFGTLRGNAPAAAPASRVLATYPANGQVNVPLRFAGEGEDPLHGVTVAGYPLSLHIAQPANVQKGSSTASNTYQLTDSNGNNIPLYTLDAISDPADLPPDTFFMLAQQPLNYGTTYHAHITGTDSQGNTFDVAWSFTTIPMPANATITQSGAYVITASSACIVWSTFGPVVTTQLLYGPTASYGSQLASIPYTGSANGAQACPQGLSSSTTYHYQVTATDAQGHTIATADATFVTAAK
jgi:uncharacterized protein YkwD